MTGRGPRLVRYAATLGTTLGVVLALAGCAGGPGPDVLDVDVRGSWVLVSGRTADGPLDLAPGARVTLAFADGSAGGTAPCNDYGAPYEVHGDRIDLGGDGGISQTLNGCEGADGALETAYLTALGHTRTVARDAGTLTLAGDGGELEFSLTPPWPRAEAVGHTWRLASWTDRTGTQRPALREAGGLPSLRLDASGRRGGPVRATSGCRAMTGRWTDGLGQPRITRSRWRGDCLHFTEQERAVESMLSELVVEVRERDGRQKLVVRDAHGSSGAQLVYRLRP